ncbi:MAG: phosphoglycerate dehydrogenase [Lachnospiraceae bacterium]|nr:phosphoglycerate dehydrogenase [Lachnospiraceae bacterium]
MKERVVITVENVGQDISREVDQLEKAGFAVEWNPTDNTDDYEQVIRAVKGSTYVIAAGETWCRQTIEGAGDQLKMIVRYGAGYDRVDLQTAKKHGICVSNTPGANAMAVAEHAFALMFAVCKKIPQYDRDMRSGLWRPMYGGEICGRTVGIIGFGAIGKSLARFLSGMCCHVIAYDIHWDEEAAKKYHVKRAGLEELIENSDFVSVHIPLTDSARAFVDKKFFEKMKPNAYFINTSRGKIVNERDLIEALKSGRIAGAGLDVFETEPPATIQELKRLDHVVLTPHVASTCGLGMHEMLKESVENILMFAKGIPRNMVLQA